jgi:hypothetical protein
VSIVVRSFLAGSLSDLLQHYIRPGIASIPLFQVIRMSGWNFWRAKENGESGLDYNPA